MFMGRYVQEGAVGGMSRDIGTISREVDYVWG